MAYKPTYVANAFLSKAFSEDVSDVDQLKLQKLVYCMHGWHLAVVDEILVGEMYEAWPYGPVLSSLYHEFKRSGKKFIDHYAIDIDPQSGDEKALMVDHGDTTFYLIFDFVWERYKALTGLQLSALTHAKNTPWTLARARGSDYLSNDEIKEHFKRLLDTLTDGTDTRNTTAAG